MKVFLVFLENGSRNHASNGSSDSIGSSFHSVSHRIPCFTVLVFQFVISTT